MKIIEFDGSKGIYQFEFNDLNSELHSHPAVEIIQAKLGSFSIELEGLTKDNLSFAVIDANVRHKIQSSGSTLEVLMLESHNHLLTEFLLSYDIQLSHGHFLSSEIPSQPTILSDAAKLAMERDLKTLPDNRIQKCLTYIQQHEIEYVDLIPILTSLVNLSDSRLSHLFKNHMGISLKKYLVWNKLKQAILLFLEGESNLTQVSVQTGFFDQAHLTNSFKANLGVSPSKAYNSRTLQS